MKKYIREHRYVLLMLYVPIYLIWFFLLEHLIASPEHCWESYSKLDEFIPFVPAFIIPYVSWYPYLLLPAVVLLWKEDRDAFIRYACFFIAGTSISLFICSVFPNCQNLRPADVDTGSFFGSLVNLIYSADTNTNVLPSMHVVGCMGVIFSCYDSKYLRSIRIPVSVWGVLVCASTVFIKQHSILDIYAGMILSLVLYLIIYVCIRNRMEAKRFQAILQALEQRAAG